MESANERSNIAGDQYRVIVGVLGIVFDDDAASEAKRQFDQFVIHSKTEGSRFFGEPVTLFRNDEIIESYRPPES
jgi:hypothetical protein